jgi:hypothetical protein
MYGGSPASLKFSSIRGGARGARAGDLVFQIPVHIPVAAAPVAMY